LLLLRLLQGARARNNWKIVHGEGFAIAPHQTAQPLSKVQLAHLPALRDFVRKVVLHQPQSVAKKSFHKRFVLCFLALAQSLLVISRLVLVEIYIKQFVLAARAALRSAVWLCQTVGLLSNPLWLRHSLAARGARED
jgi:hypothetical protein